MLKAYFSSWDFRFGIGQRLATSRTQQLLILTFIYMGLLDFLFDDDSQDVGSDFDRSVFDTDRFRNRGSSNWVDWEDVSTGDCKSDGFEHPFFDEDGEW